MAYADRIVNQEAAREGGIAAPATKILGLMRRWWRERRATRSLSGYSDAMLKDIGVSRGEIGDAVRTGRSRIRPGRRT